PMPTIQSAMFSLVAASSRPTVESVTEEVTRSIGRYVLGQLSLGIVNGVCSAIFLTIIGAPLPALLAFVAFLASLIPLIGPIIGATIITASCLMVSPGLGIAAGIYYLVYMQVEAYLLSPRIMNAAVDVPGALVIIAAIAGGTLGGVLGAVVAVPVAASALIVIRKVVVPAQAKKWGQGGSVGGDASDDDVDDELGQIADSEIGGGREDEAGQQVPGPAESGQEDEDGRSDRRQIRDQTQNRAVGLIHGSHSSNGVEGEAMNDPLDLDYPFTGRWLVQNSPADRVPSHGTARFATSYAIDFVPVDESLRSARLSIESLLRPEPPERFAGFGRPVTAPVDGTVVAVHDSEPDHSAHRGLPSLGYALTQRKR